MDYASNLQTPGLPSYSSAPDPSRSGPPPQELPDELVTADKSARWALTPGVPTWDAISALDMGHSRSTKTFKHKLGLSRLYGHEARFIVLNRIAKGSYGKFRIAVDLDCGTAIGLKEFRLSAGGRSTCLSTLQEVKQELRFMKMAHGEGLAPAIYVVQHTSSQATCKAAAFIQMSLADGDMKDFYAYMHNQGQEDLPAQQALFAAQLTQLSGQLDRFHRVSDGLRIADIKPANILIDKTKGYLLSDFGLCQPADTPHQGTCGYTPPEAFQRAGTIGTAGDVWSLGICLLHNFITAERNPFTYVPSTWTRMSLRQESENLAAYVAWHVAQQSPDGLVDVQNLMVGTAAGAPFMATFRAITRASPIAADVLLNGMLHPDPSQRVKVTDLYTWVKAWVPPRADLAQALREGFAIRSITRQVGNILMQHQRDLDAVLTAREDTSNDL